MNSIASFVLDNCKKYSKKTVLSFKPNSSNTFKDILFLDLKKNILKISFFIKTILKLECKDKICIFIENRPEWVYFDISAQCLKVIPVPLYLSTPDEEIIYILNKSKVKSIVVSNSEYFYKIISLSNELKYLESIICLDEFIIDKKYIKDHLKIFFYKDLIGKDISNTWEEELEKKVLEISKDDICTIVFTSGTCSESKGVILTHANILTNIHDAKLNFDVSSKDTFLSILPLSHIYERTCGHFLPLVIGAKISYSEGLSKFSKNLSEINPSVSLLVPRLLEKAYEKILKNVSSKSFLKKYLFLKALNFLDNKDDIFFKLKYLIFNLLVYRKIRKVFGSNLRFFMVGGAAMDIKVQKFFIDIGVLVLEGYGMTETSPVIAASSPDKYKIGTVGTKFKSLDVKISSEGEILVKGSSVMRGYYDDDNTNDIFTKDGYLKTGDLGKIDEDGFLKILGRIKDLIVTSNGKNIYPVCIEKKIEESFYIDQVCLIGDNKTYLSALIVPNFEYLKSFAKKNKISYTDKLSLVNDLKIQDLIHSIIRKVNLKLSLHEKIKKYKVLSSPFSIERGELTSTLKLKRRVIYNNYSDIIKNL